VLPKVRELELDNGFRALLVERRGLPVVASTLWYLVGSRDERTGETGLSHFLEHMMFKGTDRYRKGEIDLLTAKLGGSNNAFTSTDVTAYYFSLASDRWETALEVEASRMTGCLLDDEEFAAEKRVVLEEMAMGEDDPWTCLFHAVEAEVYRVHPYRHPVIGWREDVEKVTVAAMRDYYRRHYGPNRAFLVAVGDFDPVRTEARVRELFGALPASAPRAPVIAEPEPRGPRLAIERFPAQGDVIRLAICAPTCRMGEDDDLALDLVSQVLGGSKTSRLYQRLVVDEQTVTAVSVANEVRLDPGLLCITAELREGQDPEPVEAAIAEEIEALRRRGPTAAELRAARTQLRAGYLFEEETVLGVAMRLGRFESNAARGYRLLDGLLERYAAVSAADVKAVVGRYLAPHRCAIVRLLPEADPRANGSVRRPGARAGARSGARSGAQSGARRGRAFAPRCRGERARGGRSGR
jgi:zinc protease